MIWLGTVVLKPGPCWAKATVMNRLATAATCSHRSTDGLPFNDLQVFSNTTHLSCSPWRRDSFADLSRLYFRPGVNVLPSLITGPERQKASSRAAVHNRPSVDSAHCAVAFCRTGLHIAST